MLIEEIKNNRINIKGVKVTNDKPLDVEKPLPSHNHFALFVGLPNSGKTSLSLNLLTKYYKRQFDKIYFFSGSLGTLPDSFLKKLTPDRIYTNLDTLQEIWDSIDDTEDKVLFIFDDMVREVETQKKLISQMAMNRRHHGGGCSIWMITQKVKSIPNNVRSQIDVIYFFCASAKSRKEKEALFDDYITELDKDEYEQLMKYVFKDEPNHMFLYIDKKNSKFYKKFNELKIKE